jgi:hypothetical protein
MTVYFKDVNDLAEWLSDEQAPSSRTQRSYVLPGQEERATQMLEEGGFLLSYIKVVRCWAGISRIVGKELRPSERTDDWERSFTSYFDIEPLHVLQTPAKCFLVRESLLKSGHDGRNIYSHMRNANVCELIRERIEHVDRLTNQEAESNAGADSSFEAFNRVWEDAIDRSPFLRDLAIRLSAGKCSICGVTKGEWLDRVERSGRWPGTLSLDRVRDADFKLLHAHHMDAVKSGGTARLDNLRAVCPNCHDLLTRVSGRRAESEREQ